MELEKIEDKIPAKGKSGKSKSKSKLETPSDKWKIIQKYIQNGIVLAEQSGNKYEISVALNICPLNGMSDRAILAYHGQLMAIEKNTNVLALIMRYLRGQIYALLQSKCRTRDKLHTQSIHLFN